MAVAIGKRKRRDDDESAEDGTQDEEVIRIRFQKAFEAKFKPLERQEPLPDTSVKDDIHDESDDANDTDWSGIDDSEERMEVVNFDVGPTGSLDDATHERKAFMVRITAQELQN